MYSLEEIAHQIYQELDGIATQDEGFFVYVSRHKILDLNTLIGTNFQIANDGQVSPSLDMQAASILKCLVYIYYYDDRIRKTLNAGSVDPVTSISENGQSITILNKNESSKIWMQSKKDEYIKLQSLVRNYKLNNTSSADVAGEDTEIGVYPD